MTESQIDRSLIEEGMAVLSSDGERVGKVGQIRDDAVVVERTGDPTIHVPIAFVHNVSRGKLVLTIAANKVGEMHWETSAR
jgi:hypothetical protein